MQNPIVPLKYAVDETGAIIALSEFIPGDVIAPEFLGLSLNVDGGAITDVYMTPYQFDGGKITDTFGPNIIKIEGGSIS